MENDNDNAPIENVPKPKLTFAARLLRLFGSRRHKTQPRPGERSQSWDRELGAGGQEPAQARRQRERGRQWGQVVRVGEAVGVGKAAGGGKEVGAGWTAGGT